MVSMATQLESFSYWSVIERNICIGYPLYTLNVYFHCSRLMILTNHSDRDDIESIFTTVCDLCVIVVRPFIPHKVFTFTSSHRYPPSKLLLSAVVWEKGKWC